jgi:hypothetical protein
VASPVGTRRVSYRYEGKAEVDLVHVLDVGDGASPPAPAEVKAVRSGSDVRVDVAGKAFLFAGEGDFQVTEQPAADKK